MRQALMTATVVLTTLVLSGCTKTYEEVRQEHRDEIAAVQNALTTMKQAVERAPLPVPDAPCSQPGLQYADQPSGGAPLIELLDYRVLMEPGAVTSPTGLPPSFGPLQRLSHDVMYSINQPEDGFYAPEQERLKQTLTQLAELKYVLVERFTEGVGPQLPARVDSYLFEYPSLELKCSYALDVKSRRTLGRELGYDPRTGELLDSTFVPGAEIADIEPLYKHALYERFGLGEPIDGVSVLGADDARVQARAAAINKALEDASGLPACTDKQGLRMNKKALRIIAGGPPLERDDPNREIDPANAAPVEQYLRTRAAHSAETLLSAESWSVFEVQRGRVAWSLDGKSFEGGWLSGRLVSFDRQNQPTCATSVEIAAPETFDAPVFRQAGGPDRNQVSKVSREYLLKKIDESLGSP